MKSIKWLAVVMASAVVMISCKSKSPQELIVNKWQVTGISGGKASEIPDSVKESMKKSVMEFTADGKFNLTGNSYPYAGTYSLSADGKKITLTPTTGSGPETDIIDELTADKMSVTDSTGTKMECVSKK